MKAIEKIIKLGTDIDKDIEAIYKSDWHRSPDLQTLQYTREQLKDIVIELQSIEAYCEEQIARRTPTFDEAGFAVRDMLENILIKLRS